MSTNTKKHNHQSAHHHHEHSHNHGEINWKFWLKTSFLLFLYLYFVVINIGRFDGPIKWSWHFGIWFPITTYVVFWEGREYLKSWKKLFMGIMDMNTLIALGAHISYLYSIVLAIINWNAPMYSYAQLWEATGALIVFTNIGHALEDKVQKSSTIAFQKLNELRYSKVSITRDGKDMILPANKLKIGDIVTIKKGDIVIVDGTLLSEGDFDFANITGESKIIHLTKNQEVISGAFNAGNVIKIKISKIPEKSTLFTIIRKIEDVSMQRPKMQKFADKILKVFVPMVISISLLTFLGYLIAGYLVDDLIWPWSKDLSIWGTAIEAGVTVLAISCPCALGIATPLVYTVSSLLSAKKGIMINDPKALEELSKIKIFAFDKTGTLTNEQMDIVKIEGNKDLIGVAKSLEKNVRHPIATTILSLPNNFENVTNIKVENNQVSGEWNGKKVKIARYESKEITTNIALYVDKKVELIFAMANSIKPGVKETIRLLKRRGLKVVMITGDHQLVANDVGKRVGIENIYANASPTEKTTIIKKLKQEGKVLFVGDGFNDSVAMKKANVSVAFATGSEITNSLSDISILRNDFRAINDILTLSKMNNIEVRISLTYAFAFNIIAIPVAILMLIQPWIGAAIMSLSDILVAANAFIYRSFGARKLKIDLSEKPKKEPSKAMLKKI